MLSAKGDRALVPSAFKTDRSNDTFVNSDEEVSEQNRLAERALADERWTTALNLFQNIIIMHKMEILITF